MSITYRLPVKVGDKVEIIEYPYVESEVLKHVLPSAHGFWREAVQQMADAFPAFALTAGKADWGKAGPSDHTLIFSENGVVNVTTGNAVSGSREFYYPTWRGNLPLQVEDTPFLKKLKERLRRDPDKKAEYLRYFGKHQDKTVMLIPVNIGYSGDGHNSICQIDPANNQPWCYIPEAYFEIFDIPVDHTYGHVYSMSLYRLCQYLNHRRGIKAHDALKQRVMSRFVLDLSLANIKALGKWREFETWMRDNGTGFHQFYNIVGQTKKGKKKQNQEFLHFYRSIMREAP